MPHISFNWVDILFVTILIRIGYVGFKNGLLPEVFKLLGLLSAFILSFNNYTLLSTFLSTYARWKGNGPAIISFLLISCSILFVFKIVTAAFSLFLAAGDISKVNRVSGLLVGFGRGILLTSLIYTLFINSPFGYLSRSAEERSFSGQYVSGVASSVYKLGMKVYPFKKIETPLVRLLEE